MEATYYRDWHLAKDETEFRITELEFTMLRALEAFVRWVASADEIVGLSELKHSEHLILHVIRMQNRPKSGATIARLLNRDDLPNIQYSLRKLESAGYIKKMKEEGTKNYTYMVTKDGKKRTDDYAELRSEIFIKRLKNIAEFEAQLKDATNLLSLLTGIYEECSRTSSTLNRLNHSNRQS